MPISLYEGDGVAIAVGANSFAEHGFGDNSLTYRYSFQSLTYVLVYLLSKLFQQPTFDVFSILSALAAVGYVLLSAGIIREFSGLSFPISGLIVLSFQEAMTTAYYPNSTSLAAFLVSSGLLLTLYVMKRNPDLAGLTDPPGRKLILAAILIALGALARLDALLLVAPFLVASVWQSRSASKKWGAVLLIFLITICIWFLICDVNISEAFIDISSHLEVSYTWGLIIKSYLAFFSIFGIWLIGLGCYYLLLHKRYFELLLAFAGIFAPIVLNLQTLTTPKYFLYSLPFWGLLAAFAVELLRTCTLRLGRVLTLITTGLFIAQYIFALQVSAPGLAQPKYTAAPELIRLLHLRSNQHHIEAEILIGAGHPIYTHDQYRLTSGILFFPSYWMSAKTVHNQEVKELCARIDEKPVYGKRFSFDGETSKILVYCAQEKDFSCIRTTENQTVKFFCQKNQTEIEIEVKPPQ